MVATLSGNSSTSANPSHHLWIPHSLCNPSLYLWQYSHVDHTCFSDENTCTGTASMQPTHTHILYTHKFRCSIKPMFMATDSFVKFHVYRVPVHFVPIDVVKIFGIESILIYVALLLKKRIAVYSPNLKVLLKMTRLAKSCLWKWPCFWSFTSCLISLQQTHMYIFVC
jgi:hypothetical protein